MTKRLRIFIDMMINKTLIMDTLYKLSSIKIILFLFFTFIGLTLISQNETTKSEFLSFYRYNPERLTWDEHKKRATEMGGDLACITNTDENEQVRRIAGGEIVWIGGIRKGCGNGPGSDYWKWSNGKEWSYTNWRVGEPNNSPSSHDPYSEYDENRVMMWENGEWNDASSLHELSAIYEIPLNRSVEYYDNDIKENLDYTKRKRNSFRMILGSILSTGIILIINSSQRVK